MSIATSFRTILIIGALLGALSACEKPGPAEKAGQDVDEALEKTGEKIEEIGDDIHDAVTDDSN